MSVQRTAVSRALLGAFLASTVLVGTTEGALKYKFYWTDGGAGSDFRTVGNWVWDSPHDGDATLYPATCYPRHNIKAADTGNQCDPAQQQLLKRTGGHRQNMFFRNNIEQPDAFLHFGKYEVVQLGIGIELPGFSKRTVRGYGGTHFGKLDK